VIQTAEDGLGDDLAACVLRPNHCRIVGRALAKRSMRAPMIKQQSLRTPTEPSFRNFYIRGIRGLASASAFTSRSKSRMVLSFAVACMAAGLRFQPGCSIGLRVPGRMLRLMRMSN
jgi:hypothetical protein